MISELASSLTYEHYFFKTTQSWENREPARRGWGTAYRVANAKKKGIHGQPTGLCKEEIELLDKRLFFNNPKEEGRTLKGLLRNKRCL